MEIKQGCLLLALQVNSILEGKKGERKRKEERGKDERRKKKKMESKEIREAGR